MKNIKKILACIMVVGTLFSFNPITSSAISITVYNEDGIGFELGYDEKVIGWNDDGTPIIVEKSNEELGAGGVVYNEDGVAFDIPDDKVFIGWDEDGNPIISEILIPDSDVEPVIGDSEETPVLGDSTQKADLNETPTGIRGDVNYDGEVDAIDLLLLKKYILQIITW